MHICIYKFEARLDRDYSVFKHGKNDLDDHSKHLFSCYRSSVLLSLKELIIHAQSSPQMLCV